MEKLRKIAMELGSAGLLSHQFGGKPRLTFDLNVEVNRPYLHVSLQSVPNLPDALAKQIVSVLSKKKMVNVSTFDSPPEYVALSMRHPVYTLKNGKLEIHALYALDDLHEKPATKWLARDVASLSDLDQTEAEAKMGLITEGVRKYLAGNVGGYR